MRHRLVPLGLAALLAASAAPVACHAAAGSAAAGELLYVGTRLDGPGDTLFSARFDEATGQLSGLAPAASIPRPTWLAADPAHARLYAVSELGNDGKSHGFVYSLSVDPVTARLTVLNKVDSSGGGPTHLALDPAARLLFVANFGTGQAAALPINADGTLSPATSVQADQGSGPLPRQKGPHAHAVTVAPGGRFLLVADLGADRVFIDRIDQATRRIAPSDPASISFPPGTGPRHVAFSADGRLAVVMSELSATLFSFRWDAEAGTLTPLQTLSTLPEGFSGKKSGGEILFSPDGRFLYVTDRGDSNQIVTYSVDPSTGHLAEIQRVPSGGGAPWSASLSPGGHWLIVANQGSGSLDSFRIDPATGRLSPAGTGLKVSQASNITFYAPPTPGG